MDINLTTTFFFIFSGAALLASLALLTRQPLLIAYIALGALIGPYGAAWVTDVNLLAEVAEFGIIFLLFLLGLDMQPSALANTIKNSSIVALLSSAVFFIMGFAPAWLFGYTTLECLVVGAAMMFSSTIIGIKLLPTTVLHHKQAGEIMIGLLLIQDLLAIFVLLVLLSFSTGELNMMTLGKTLVSLPALVAFAFGMVKWILLPLITRFDRVHEYIFLLALGWCLGLAELANHLGLSAEIGAFIAGISLATSPIAQYIATSLKPLRDFFLVLFFFTLGARFDLALLSDVVIPAAVLALLVIAIKPLTYRYLLGGLNVKKRLAWDVGFRLGQISEFSLLIAYVAFGGGLIGKEASHFIQATAIITFVISSYIVVLNCYTPLAVTDKLRRD